MKCVLFIEQNGRRNAVKLSFDDSPSVLVGRSWRCDITLTDKFVDSEHFQISANEDKFVIEDLDTENGTTVEECAIIGSSPYKINTNIRVGETTLRLIDANTKVAPTEKYVDDMYGAVEGVGLYYLTFVTTAMVMLAVFVDMLWGSYEFLTWQKYLDAGMRVFYGIACWTMACGVFGKLFHQKAQFGIHWSVICCMATFAFVLSLFANFAMFNLNSQIADTVISHGIVLVPALLLCIVTITVFKGKIFSYILGMSLVCVGYFTYAILPTLMLSEQERWSDHSTITHTGQPPQLFFGKTVSLDEHIDKSSDIFERLESQL